MFMYHLELQGNFQQIRSSSKDSNVKQNFLADIEKYF